MWLFTISPNSSADFLLNRCNRQPEEWEIAMLRHERLKPPIQDYPPSEWSVLETNFRPEFMAQMESVLALGNGYMGMRGGPEEGEPCAQNGTFVNGFYETWPIIYGEEAFGFARTGQTMLNVTDSKIIKLFVDDEPFELDRADLRQYSRQLNMKAGTLDRDLIWETPSGKQLRIKSRRLISFQQRHVAAIYYEVTVLNAAAAVVIPSGTLHHQSEAQKDEGDPRQAKFSSPHLQPRASVAKDRRIILVHGTERSQTILACAVDHDLATGCPYSWKTDHWENSGVVVFTIEAGQESPIHLTKYMAYHTSKTATPAELSRQAEWTLDRVAGKGFASLLAEQEQYMDRFWQRSDVRVSYVKGKLKLSTVELQQAIRMNLFHILQASARAENCGVAAKGLTGNAYEGHYFWDTEIYLFPFLVYTSPLTARNLLLFRYRMLDQARARARELSHRGALFPWRTISGEEASAYYAAGTAQYHINADIMYALRKYVNITGDEEFLFQYGAEMLVETARFWYDLGFFSPGTME